MVLHVHLVGVAEMVRHAVVCAGGTCGHAGARGLDTGKADDADGIGVEKWVRVGHAGDSPLGEVCWE